MKNTLDKGISCCREACQCQQPRWGQESKRGGGGRRKEGDGGTPATLTRRRPHTSRAELPQDEALLALGQRQEEFIGFDALLTETEAHGILNLGRGWRASPMQRRARGGKQLGTWLSASPSMSARKYPGILLARARVLLCYVASSPDPFFFFFKL